MSGHELDDATIARWWHEQSSAQGMGDEIPPAQIQRVYVLASTGNDDGPGTRPGRRSTTPPPHATKGHPQHATAI